MSATFPFELKVLIEQVVRPLPAPLDRQKRLRSDFQEHLQTIYAEELARDGNPAAALAQTKLRFGNPAELTRELRDTIRWGDRVSAWLENYWLQRLGEPTFWYVMRLAVRFCTIVTGLFFTFVLADTHFFGTRQVSLLELRAVLAIVIFMTVWFLSFLVFGLHAGELWTCSPKKWGRIFAFSVGLIVSWPLSLMLLMYLTNFSWNNLKYPLAMALIGALTSGVGGTLVGIFHSRDTRYRHEWASLNLN